jgi:hypothetical protein
MLRIRYLEEVAIKVASIHNFEVGVKEVLAEGDPYLYLSCV